MSHTHESHTSEPSTKDTIEERKETPAISEADTNTASPEVPTEQPVPPARHSRAAHIKNAPRAYWSHKKWTLPATLFVLLVIVALVPAVRYRVLGLFMKETFSITVTDSTTQMPVSGVRVTADHVTVTTAANGRATLRLPVGYASLGLTKQYYRDTSSMILVSYIHSHNSIQIHLVAIGRQVPITVLNKITTTPIADAELQVLGTEIKTDKNGTADIVLPVDKPELSGTVTAPGYNSLATTVQVTSQSVPGNTYYLTPAGNIYFLSNLSGKVDVVKTNLDGTNRQTVLAGTGNESPSNTVLLASRDWKYLALLTQRGKNGNPELDLIDTSTDTMSNIDEGNAQFTLVGWDGDRFIYQVNRTGVSYWQNGQEALKSFNAPTKSITVLAQTSGVSLSPPYSYLYQQFGSIYIAGSKVIYPLNWYGNNSSLNGQQATLNAVNPDGSSATVVKSFSNTSYSAVIYVYPYDGPSNLEIGFSGQNNVTTYYTYQNGQLAVASDITDQTFYNYANTTYLQSPSGNQTFWSVPADGKNNLLVGDANGNNGKKVAILSDYNIYGWYTDNYVLVSKNSSELYIMPVGGGTPLRITDYFKPSQFFSGYGGGYGGL